MTRLLLLMIYPLLLARRMANRLRGRDPLRLAKPGGSSLWIVRPAPPSSAQYFSQSATAEQRSGLANAALRSLAGGLAPPRMKPGEKFSAAADREQGIPDEVYTLW
jgi:hypothetical protein